MSAVEIPARPSRSAPVAGSSASIAPAADAASDHGLLINIDNGGTLTDICVIDGARTWRTKTVTTPYDLSKCLFDGLLKASKAVYGEDDLQRLLLATDYIRYSTTQGTNALVQRKGPRLGLICGGDLDAAALRADGKGGELFDALVGDRVVQMDTTLDDTALETAVTRAVTTLASAGANRVVVAFGGGERGAQEIRLKKVLLRKFPAHLLGAVPILYSHEVVEDGDDARRAWTALFNAFLHPAMERFLYSAEHRLRDYKTRNPLLIFRNDGHSARVAKTIAIKTYSSGPRGGAEGAKALAAHYGFGQLLSMDIGGTTTDVALVAGNTVRVDRFGEVEGVPTSFPLCDVDSIGVGGSSIIRVEGGKVLVGPESVGGAPGPACFGLGGTAATITDAFLASGLLDPASYFGGDLKIDVARARSAIEANVARPLGVSPDEALAAMEQAWVAKVAGALKKCTTITPDTALAAFGGAGPFVVCKLAEAAGIGKVVIPSLAAVFSAYGIGFSDIGHQYEMPLAKADAATLAAAREALTERALRGMFAEGASLDACRLSWELRGADGSALEFDGETLPKNLGEGGSASLVLHAIKPTARASMHGHFGGPAQPAGSAGTRVVGGQPLPLYRVEDQPAGARAQGPAVLEEAFFTCRVDAGWSFEINDAGDILLQKT